MASGPALIAFLRGSSWLLQSSWSAFHLYALRPCWWAVQHSASFVWRWGVNPAWWLLVVGVVWAAVVRSWRSFMVSQWKEPWGWFGRVCIPSFHKESYGDLRNWAIARVIQAVPAVGQGGVHVLDVGCGSGGAIGLLATGGIGNLETETDAGVEDSGDIKAASHSRGAHPKDEKVQSGTRHGVPLTLNRVHGLDPSVVMIEICREKFRGQVDSGHVVLHQTRGDTLPFASASFDLIVSFNTTHLLANLASTFRDWKRCLRPGGAVAVGFMTLSSAMEGATYQTAVVRGEFYAHTPLQIESALRVACGEDFGVARYSPDSFPEYVLLVATPRLRPSVD